MSKIDKLTSREIKALFDMPPEKAIEHLKSKGLHIGWDWADTHALAHARSFTIAKMTALDMLSTTKKAIEQAMTDGTGYKGFENTIKPYLISQGWWGQTVGRNPKTGQLEQVRLGSHRRLKTIYHTNRRTAVMTAKYERMKQATDTHPYWQYSAVLDRRTRPSHSAKHGVIYRHDDPFWSHSYPPNGFGCRCSVKAISVKQADKIGISKSNDETTVLGENGFGGSPVASHLFDKLWYNKTKQALGQKHALQAIAKDMASDVRVAGFLAWVRQLQASNKLQGKTYGVGVLSESSFSKLASEHGVDMQELSPVVGLKDIVVAGKKYDRHTKSGDALDEIALEKIIRDFGKPDYELWDSKNKSILLVYKTNEGLRVARHDEFYKNKPANVAKIINDRVWRYTGTDHTSGAVYCHYYFGGETSANLCDFFIRMMSPKADTHKDPIRGVPKMVMLDPGSANTSSAFKTLCAALDVQVHINKPNNPRAKGQVEKANDIVETHFESGLKFVAVSDIDTLNVLCDKWLRYFNGQITHSRHGMTRYQAWNKIKSDELVNAPPSEYCKTLALSVPTEAKVMPTLEVKYKGKLYDVSALPILVGQKVLVAQNPWQVGGARVCVPSEMGDDWREVPEVVFDEMGFRENAVVVGQSYKAHSDTLAQTHAKEMEKLIMGADTLDAAEQKRKAKALPFDGKIDPYKHNDEVLKADNKLYMPKQGQTLAKHEQKAQTINEPTLSKVEIAKQLKPKVERMGGDWSKAVKVLVERYPNGIIASQIDEVFDELCEKSTLTRILKIA